jgi:ATP-dependent RNA helicase DDX41
MEALAAISGIKGCAYCGGLGHRIADCPKLRSESKAQERSKKDYFGSGGFGGEM